MAKLTLRDIGNKLKEKLQQGATSFAQTLPPVQAYNAGKQTVQSVKNYFNPTSNQGNNFWGSAPVQKYAQSNKAQYIQGLGEGLNQAISPYTKLLGEAAYQVGRKVIDPQFKNQNLPVTKFLTPEQVSLEKGYLGLPKVVNTAVGATSKAQLATLGASNPFNLLATGAISSGLGYGLGRVSGMNKQDASREAGRAAGYSPVYAGINKITGGPSDTIAKTLLGSNSNLIPRILTKGSVTGATNVLENMIFTPMTELRNATKGENTLAFLTGMFGSAAGETTSTIFNNVKSAFKKANPELNAAQVEAGAKAYIRDKFGRFTKQATGVEPVYAGQMTGKKDLVRVSNNQYVSPEFAKYYSKVDKELRINPNFDIRKIDLGMSVKDISKPNQSNFFEKTPDAQAGLYDVKDLRGVSPDEFLPVKKRPGEIARDFFDEKGSKQGTIRYGLQDGKLVIQEIYADKKGTGAGSKIIEGLKKWSDANNIPLSVTGHAESQAIPYWRKMGFTVEGDINTKNFAHSGKVEYIPNSNVAQQPVYDVSKPLYHGSDYADVIRKEGFKLGGKSERSVGPSSNVDRLGKGIYFADNADDAARYAKSWNTKDVVESYVKSGVKIKEFSDYKSWYDFVVSKSPKALEDPKLLNNIFEKEGYGGVKLGGDTVVFNPKDVTVNKPLSVPSTKGVESIPVNNLEVPQSTKLQSQIPEQVLKDPLTSSIPPQKTYSSLPTEASLKKNMLKQEKLAQKAANDDYKAWQQSVFKEAGATRTPYMQSKTNIENIGKSLSKSTAHGGVKADELKDISGFKAYTRDIYRNFKEVYGPKYENIKRVLLDPFDKSKGDLSRNYINWGKRINKEVEVGLGIKKGSKESAATQMFGEGKTSYEELVRDFGKNKADNIVKADQWFRKEYDQLLNEVNATMKRVYPNNPEKQIPKRQDYYRHFRDMGQGLSGLLNIFDSPSNIASGLAGTSEFTKPKSKWLSFAQRRLGGQTDIDAVGGFIDYVKAAEYNKNIDPHTAKFRALAEDLVAQTENDPKLNGFIEYLSDFAGDLAGKTNPADRFVQKVIPGGRKAMSVLNWLNSRVKANVILGNASSSIAQIFNVPQGIADAGVVNSTKGLGLSIANLFGEATPINKSNFVTERYSGSAFDVFDRGIVNNTKKFAAWMTGALDELGTKYIWNSEYAKAISEGVENPIKYADDVTRSLVAGRGVGEVPLIQKSKLFQLAAPFQLEVANLWHVMGDWVGQKQFGKLATFFLASYIFNRGAEQIRGSDVSFDPIQASVDAYNAYKEEEDKKVGLMRAGGRLAGEVISNIPLGQTLASAYPEYGATVGDTKLPTREQFFGEGDPTRFGSGLLVAKGLQDPLYKILPPFGGQQFKRTIEGIKATQKGFSESKTGRVRFPTEQTPLRQVQRAVFGEYSTPNARNYFDSESSVLGEKQSETFKRLLKTEPTKAQEYYNSIINTRKNNKKQTSQTDSNSSLEVSAAENGETLGSKTLEYIKDGKLLTVDLNKSFDYPTMDTSTSLGKEAISRYKADISAQVNKIYDAYKDGKITEQEASDYINKLSVAYDKTKKAKGSKKPKKITLKVSSYKAPKITIKKRSSAKLPTIKFKRPKKTKIVRRYTIK